MLICPQCTFENPDSNKFCQCCGISLTHKICPECSADVALKEQYCHRCGAECGTIFYALITQAVNNIVAAGAETGELTANSENVTDDLFGKFTLDSYLDPQQRYRVLASLGTPEVIGDYGEIIVKVIDCQPYQVSPMGQY